MTMLAHTRLRRPWHFLPATLWLILVSVLSLLPGTTITAMADNSVLASLVNIISMVTLADIFGIDKVFHAGLYAVLVALLLRPVVAPTARRIWLTALAATAFGSLMEVLQAYVQRAPSVWDALANAIGATAVAAAWWWLWWRRRAATAQTATGAS